MTPPGYSLADAAAMLLVSTATVRRRIDDGELAAVAWSGPQRVDTESLRAAQKEILLRMRIDQSGSELLGEKLSASQRQIDDLAEVVANLRMGHQLLLDSIATLTPLGTSSQRQR